MAKLIGYLGKYPLYDRVPDGWDEIELATTAPNGYVWYGNNESLFSGKRKSGLVEVEYAKHIIDVNGETISVGDKVRTKQYSGGLIAPAESDVGEVVLIDGKLAIEYLDEQGRISRRLLHGQINEKLL